MTEESPDETTEGECIALVPNRLAATHTVHVRPVLSDPLVEAAVHLSSDWQCLSSRAEFFEMSAVMRGVQRDRMAEVVGLTAAVGEQIALARAAMIECELWQQKRDADDGIGDEMCHRAMTEVFGHFVLGAGHALASLTARVLALDSRLHEAISEEFHTTFAPHSNNSLDWLSTNSDTAKSLRRIGRSAPLAAAAGVPDGVSMLARSAEWRRLSDLRAAYFHRRRAQSGGVVGVPLASLWTQSSPGSWTLTRRQRRPYLDGDGVAKENHVVTRGAFRALVAASVSFEGARADVVNAIFRGAW